MADARQPGNTGSQRATGSQRQQDSSGSQRGTASQRSTSSQRSSSAASTASQRSVRSAGSSSQRSTGSLHTTSQHSVRGTTTLSNTRLEAIINKALSLTAAEFEMNLSVEELLQLCDTVTTVLRGQPALVETTPPISVCGDIHGQFQDLKRIFATIGYPPARRYMFLGDIVDRGRQSIETAVLLMAYKARYPDKFFLLRGNHECGSINRTYGFYEEIERRYGQHSVQLLWDQFNNAFAWLPYAGMVGAKILCMHGGITLQMRSVQQLRELRRPFVDPPNPSLELDLLWADPDQAITGVQPSPRGVSVVFGPDVLATVCSRLNITLVVRAHQCVPYGAQFFGNNRLLTVFSAPHYEGQGNVGAVLQIEGHPPQCSFRFFN